MSESDHALVADHWAGYWAYVIGPLVGGAIAVVFAWILRGRPTVAGSQTAQGELHSEP